MKLLTVSFQGYKSIRDKQTLVIDRHVTVLIGANDHGKSNVLSGIQSLDPRREFTLEERNWDVESGELPEIIWEFNLSKPETQRLLTAADEANEREMLGCRYPLAGASVRGSEATSDEREAEEGEDAEGDDEEDDDEETEDGEVEDEEGADEDGDDPQGNFSTEAEFDTLEGFSHESLPFANEASGGQPLTANTLESGKQVTIRRKGLEGVSKNRHPLRSKLLGRRISSG